MLLLLNFFVSPFLAVQSSFWPIVVSVSLFSLTVNIVLWANLNISLWVLILSGCLVLLLSLLWWNDVVNESISGYHTHKLEVSLRSAMLLFILSEVFFFLSFFWAFFDSSLAPTVELGMAWPPNGITPLTVYSVPLLNTVILLSSGITVTWAHHALMNNFFTNTVVSLGVTVVLGAYFLSMQWLEYNEAMFSMADGAYGSTFFIATGFHGMHVVIGTTFLFYVFLSLINSVLTWDHHFSFEAAAWYWHFVDVVWLILFLNFYWWGSLTPSLEVLPVSDFLNVTLS